MNIVTFGSCLSRYTANQYVRLFEGTIISSVYHNRSDAFVGKFIDKNWNISPFETVAGQILGERALNADNNPNNILKNQYAEWIGLHRLAKGIPLLQVLEQKMPDLIIMDNYMDLAGKLMVNEHGEGYFLRLSDLKPKSNNWTTPNSYLSPEDGIAAMKTIIAYFRNYVPNAKIVFINFPHNTYVGSLDRIRRTQEYEQKFHCENVHIIPCMTVPEVYQTEDKQHFKSQQYAAYAGMIWSMIR